ncbi:cAMP-binding proteins - catabolite gene activator and regulatory subunit of cAMP-dependent protein kinases [Vibrio jasicida]|uniref:Crp/Fnr family transcriptional regulator n=1 Tax=Vibrio jasicida TaxID=766224 RepID=UPI00289626A4|nr:cAMP-binding proteins - catabolite gene activator and regulatory subunit of cAMP-dependent protein kinases [Vibrio jasicida]
MLGKFTKVIDYFSDMGVPPQTVEPLSTQFKLLSLNPSDILLAQGSQQDYGFFIMSGILRACHYGENGLERCKEFYFQDELCFLYSSWLQGMPTQYQIEAITAVEVIRIPLNLLALPSFSQAKVTLLQQQLIFKEQKEALLLLHTPEQRYQHLLQYWPHWLAKLNNIQIASYIGISPVSLSRLKARIKS